MTAEHNIEPHYRTGPNPGMRGHFIPWTMDIEGTGLVEGELGVSVSGQIIGWFKSPRGDRPTYSLRQMARQIAGRRGDAAFWERLIIEELRLLIRMSARGIS